jgi:hypothetical protein
MTDRPNPFRHPDIGQVHSTLTEDLSHSTPAKALLRDAVLRPPGTSFAELAFEDQIQFVAVFALADVFPLFGGKLGFIRRSEQKFFGIGMA